jgi:hypothetical protein
VTTDNQAKASLWDEKTEKTHELGPTPFQASYKELFEKIGSWRIDFSYRFCLRIRLRKYFYS